ncbi:MAG TPA: hypothetical protein VN253_20170 [Kofleriaceae bacterium]|nr:hypothetical protein [Kofleriaceae bacterium]
MKIKQTVVLVSWVTGTLAACGVEPSDPRESLGSTNQALTTNDFGFAWSNQLTGTFNPSSSYAANTGGGPITIENVSTGTYAVTFGGLGGSGGNAQVVAHGTDNTRCKVQSWYQSGSDERVNVLCHTPAGDLINSRFVVRYGRATSSYPSAYLWANQPSAASYTPSTTYNFNSTGVANTITRSAAGTYTVNLPGLGGANGSVLVTAHGSSSTHCNVVMWGSLPGNRPIEVRCWDTAGVLTDSTFSLAFDGAGVTGYHDVGAFAWANDAASASYTPSASYSYDSGGFACDSGANTAGKLSTGRYFMRHTIMPAVGSTVHVTARNYPGAADYCKVESWISWTNGVEVKTRCFNASGAPTDSQYAESYYTYDVQGPC